ncbi:fumarylacetoacetate hydrolase family protein [Hippea maritima]|uniref:Fumarylacetoacetate (FAA) hydrolase n=1 Tax=Hippea maritima (strain ATCC 700847 / DSM 10411 / MH2) TaxID=760142 RepID=F2LTU4_HIPMA|nr:fumarylacetoacetate hydrolase family protein [Hippea maritima]AEA34470.1 fumarylacetoacetate (FAA) hydrolase [Hippea maritima DSM 10411]
MKGLFFEDNLVCPSKVVCIARNYVEHIKELNNEQPGNITLFIKPNSSVSTQLFLPNFGECHYEAEISFLVKDGDFVGVGFGIDLTLRDVQSALKDKGLPWEKAKAFDNAAVFSDFVAIDKDDVDKLGIELYINDQLKQKGDVSLMINKPYEILNEAKKYFSFCDYDVLMTGTPKGVGRFNRGDRFLGRILLNDKAIIEKEWNVR